jgi:hypothetical protein
MLDGGARGAVADPADRGGAAAGAAALGRVPGDGVILVGETALEREWCAAGLLAGWIPAARYFGAGAGEI